jgi:hypothetical protein
MRLAEYAFGCCCHHPWNDRFAMAQERIRISSDWGQLSANWSITRQQVVGPDVALDHRHARSPSAGKDRKSAAAFGSGGTAARVLDHLR